MKLVLQRVSGVVVSVAGREESRIGLGLLILLGIEKGDTRKEADYLLSKVLSLRVFEDEDGKMNWSVCRVQGQIMIVSQFTLLADCRKGNRPSFDKAANPAIALELVEYFTEKISRDSGLIIKSGRFAANMSVNLVNEGPVTIVLEKKNEGEMEKCK